MATIFFQISVQNLWSQILQLNQASTARRFLLQNQEFHLQLLWLHYFKSKDTSEAQSEGSPNWDEPRSEVVLFLTKSSFQDKIAQMHQLFVQNEMAE